MVIIARSIAEKLLNSWKKYDFQRSNAPGFFTLIVSKTYQKFIFNRHYGPYSLIDALFCHIEMTLITLHPIIFCILKLWFKKSQIRNKMLKVIFFMIYYLQLNIDYNKNVNICLNCYKNNNILLHNLIPKDNEKRFIN